MTVTDQKQVTESSEAESKSKVQTTAAETKKSVKSSEPKPKKAQGNSRKRKETPGTGTTKPKKVAKKNPKKTQSVYDKLSAGRKREVSIIARRAATNDIITPAFLTAAIRKHKITNRKLESVDEAQKLMIEMYEGLDEEEKKNQAEKHQKMLDRFNKIKISYQKGHHFSLNHTDDVFLNKFKKKKPLSGYMLFAKDQRAVVKEEVPDLTFGGIGKEIGKRWADLSDKAKQEWTDRAREEFEANAA